MSAVYHFPTALTRSCTNVSRQVVSLSTIANLTVVDFGAFPSVPQRKATLLPPSTVSTSSSLSSVRAAVLLPVLVGQTGCIDETDHGIGTVFYFN